jgi:hypothetical protein
VWEQRENREANDTRKLHDRKKMKQQHQNEKQEKTKTTTTTTTILSALLILVVVPLLTVALLASAVWVRLCASKTAFDVQQRKLYSQRLTRMAQLALGKSNQPQLVQNVFLWIWSMDNVGALYFLFRGMGHVLVFVSRLSPSLQHTHWIHWFLVTIQMSDDGAFARHALQAHGVPLPVSLGAGHASPAAGHAEHRPASVSLF